MKIARCLENFYYTKTFILSPIRCLSALRVCVYFRWDIITVNGIFACNKFSRKSLGVQKARKQIRNYIYLLYAFLFNENNKKNFRVYISHLSSLSTRFPRTARYYRENNVITYTLRSPLLNKYIINTYYNGTQRGSIFSRFKHQPVVNILVHALQITISRRFTRLQNKFFITPYFSREYIIIIRNV